MKISEFFSYLGLAFSVILLGYVIMVTNITNVSSVNSDTSIAYLNCLFNIVVKMVYLIAGACISLSLANIVKKYE
jgi:hypothetical protein